MGKKQAGKDRLYLTTTEWREEYGGYKQKKATQFHKLPFHCCAISFTPFEDPVCTADGFVFDIVNIVPYIQKHKRHPVTGEPLRLQDLIRLTFHKNTSGEYHCPVLNKVFTEHTHIVAVRVTGNVYCYEAVQELNIKPKNWKDLLTEEPFTRKDIITLQDPLNASQRTIDQFDHVQKDLEVEVGGGEGAGSSDLIRNANEDMRRALGALGTKEASEALVQGGGGKRAQAERALADARSAAVPARGGAASTSAGTNGVSAAAAAATAGAAAAAGASGGAGDSGDWRLRAPVVVREDAKFKPGASTWDTDDPKAQPGQGRKGSKKKQQQQLQPGAAGSSDAAALTPQQRYESHVKYVSGSHTTGAMSRGFTSTVAPTETRNARSLERLNRNPTKKGYVRLHTSLGDVNLELHCDTVPRTCENFLGLLEMGYYDGTVFHRSIKNFMIQGGDPTGTGTGGESIYGATFKDEFDGRLQHSGRGILSMANSGPHTNGSQFFILYKSARHLDYKHTVFGRVVGGLDVLSAMEQTPTDAEDRPKQAIRFIGATVFTNPYKEMEEAEKAAEEAAASQARDPQDDPEQQVGTWYSNPNSSAAVAPSRSGVGKYITAAQLPGGSAPAAAAPPAKAAAAGAAAAPAEPSEPPAAKRPKPTPYSNFDAW